METRMIYCTARDADVEVMLPDGHEVGSEQPDLVGAVCLDIGATCTGSACPICAVSRQRIMEELAAFHLRMAAM